MTKAELIEKLCKDAAVTKSQADQMLKSFVEAVAKTTKKGGKMTLIGFGTFGLSKRKARTGRNPATGAAIKIKASKTVSFHASKTLKESL